MSERSHAAALAAHHRAAKLRRLERRYAHDLLIGRLTSATLGFIVGVVVLGFVQWLHP